MRYTAAILNSYLEKQIDGIGTIYNDSFPTDTGNEVISRFDPSQASEKEFLDGSRIGVVHLAYYCRHKKADKAREIMQTITDLCRNRVIESEEYSRKITCDAETLPQFVSVDDKKQTYYTASIAVSYEVEATE